MEVTIDRFGRILIPKKIREELALEPGTPICLEMVNGTLTLSPKYTRLVEQKIGNLIVFDLPGSEEPVDFDIVELIKESREERDKKVSGLGE